MVQFLFRIWRRWLRAEIVFGFFIATMFWVGILGWQAADAPTDADNKKCYEAAQQAGHKSEECKSLWERTTSDPVAFFTFWLVVFTGGLTVSTVMLWLAGERQIEFLRESAASQSRDTQDSIAAAARSADAAVKSATVAEQSLIEVQRALVVPTRFTSNQLFNKDVIVGFQVTAILENVGSTAAVHFVGTANFVAREDDLPPDFPYPDGAISGAANGTVGPRIPSIFPLNIAIRDINDIASKRKRGFFYGWVEYDDIFGRKRRTEFCVEITVFGRPDIPLPKNSASILSFAGYGPYNGIDNECRYKPGSRPPVEEFPAVRLTI